MHKLECNRKRRPFGILAVILSAIVFALLIISLILLIIFQRKTLFAFPGRLDTDSRRIANFAMIAFCIGIVSALFGVASGCLKHRALPFTLGVCLTPVWVLFFVSATAIGLFLMTSDAKMDALCGGAQGEMTLADSQLSLLFSDYANQIDKKIDQYANKWMCSAQCPCDDTAALPWLALSESELNAKGRTKNSKDTVDTDGTVLLLATKPTGKTTDFFPTSFL